MNSVVLFDYGGVLGNHHQEPAESELASLLGISVPRCRELTSERSAQGRAFREDRISEAEFWHCVAREAGVAVALPPAMLSRLWAETYRINRDVLDAVTALRQRHTVGVLSNIDRARSEYLVHTVGLLEYIDVFFPSYRFGAIKPSQLLFQRVDAQLRTKPHEATVVYVDDRQSHTEACLGVNWSGLLYREPAGLVEAVERELERGGAR